MAKSFSLLLMGILVLNIHAHSQTEISGNITSDSVFTEGSHYILTGNLTIKSNATLTIQKNAQVDMGSYRIYVGSSTAGTLNASEVLFFTESSTERIIKVKDGGSVNLSSCQFKHVSIDIDDDAGEVILTTNQFEDVKYPIVTDINQLPVLQNNTSTVSLIGLNGYVEQDLTLSKLQWNYILTRSITVRKDATLAIAEDVRIDLKSSKFIIGSSSAGNLQADGNIFTSSSSSDKTIQFSDGGIGTINNCIFDNVYIEIDPDAGEQIVLTNNNFTHITWPVIMSPQSPPLMENNESSVQMIGLNGKVSENCSLYPMEWPFVLTESVTIKDQAILTIQTGTRIQLNNKTLNIGSSSSNNGSLIANGAYFYEPPNNHGRVYFKANSTGTITNSAFDNARLWIYGASPTIENCRFSHCQQAIVIEGETNPVIQNNDFYNNTLAIDNRGNITINAIQNWWAHLSGPKHESNTEGLGETIEGEILFTPFLTSPAEGEITAEMEPESVLFTDMITGEKYDSAFYIRNTGNEDLLVTGIMTSSSSVSVVADNRFWILPDSSVRMPYSFTALDPGPVSDTIFINSNDPDKPEQLFYLEGQGNIESYLLNFYHINVDSFPKVKCHFTLSDQAYLPVRTLLHDQLELSEQYELISEYELTTRTANSAISVGLVLDNSGSMAGQAIRDARSAAIDFVQNLSPFDEACVVNFGGKYCKDQVFTTDKNLLIEAINSGWPHGSTALFSAIDQAIDQAKDRLGIRAILALSDGNDNISNVTAGEVIEKARLYGINIYTIGLGDDAEPTLRSIAYETGGQYFYSPTSKDLAMIYRMISGQLQNLYVLTYIADEEGPFPRKVELKVHIDDLDASAYKFYSIGNTEIDLAGACEPFGYDDLAVESVNYLYYYVSDVGSLIPEGFSFSWFMGSKRETFPMTGTYLGKGVMQFKMDLSVITKTGVFPVSFPDSLDHSGGWLKLKNKPADFDVNLVPKSITQSIDLFAGGSVGASLIAGGIGAGPSVAAASVSASGHGGMGMTFERDGSGNEWISRRLEAGVSVGVEAPSVNTVIDVVEAGASAEISTTGTVGQTLLFPGDHSDPDLILKAKAAYVLETLSIGATATSPYFGIVMTAVIQSLKVVNPDVNEIYDDLFESWNLGANIEGSVGIEFSLSAGESSGLPEFTFAEASASMAMGGSMIHYVQTDELSFQLALANGFDMGLLNLEVADIDLFSVFGYSLGSEISLGADFSTSDGFNALNLGYLAFESASLAYGTGFNGYSMDINVPKVVIVDGINRTGTLINDVYHIFEPGSGIPDLRVGVDQLSGNIQEFFCMQEDTLLTPEDHITVEIGEQWTKGIDFDLSIGLDLAVGIGAGLSFGVNLTYFDELSAPKSDYIIAHGMLLPLYKSAGVSSNDKIFSLTDEMEDLFYGAIALVTDGIANLVEVFEFALEYGIDFASSTLDGTCELAGNTWSAATAKITSADPRKWSIWDDPFMDSRLQYRYSSNRVGKENKPWNMKSGNTSESELYLTSFAFDVSLFNEDDELVDEFEALQLKLAINAEMLTELGFTEEDKALARIYRYVPETISWIRMDEDLCTDPDSVSVDITRSATYAVGIEIFPEYDKTAPEIIDYNPKEEYDVAPNTRIWAKLYEGRMGVGVDLSRTRIILDDVELNATWDPVNSIIAHLPKEPMEIGEHQMTIIAGDYQGNTTELTVNFTVHSSGLEMELNIPDFETQVFPNPFSESLTIEYTSTSSTETDVAIYDLTGARIVCLFKGMPSIGVNQIGWDRMQKDGSFVSPGLYFVRIRQADRLEVSKIIIK